MDSIGFQFDLKHHTTQKHQLDWVFLEILNHSKLFLSAIKEWIIRYKVLPAIFFS